MQQKVSTKVSLTLGDNLHFHYLLDRCLPGQRDGASNWNEPFTEYAKESFGAEICVERPTLMRAQEKFVGMLHVDDLLGLAEEEFVWDVIVPQLEKKYEISVECLTDEDHCVSFLKRFHHWHNTSQRLILQPHPKHLKKLFDVMGLNPTRTNARSTPMPSAGIQADLSAEPLDFERAAKYKAAVGILLYMSPDLPECHFSIKTVSQAMSSPGKEAWRLLLHLCRYLIQCQNRGIACEIPEQGQGAIVHDESRSIFWKFSQTAIGAGIAWTGRALVVQCSCSTNARFIRMPGRSEMFPSQVQRVNSQLLFQLRVILFICRIAFDLQHGTQCSRALCL